MKKILLTESEKKAIISEREQAIINNFAKTFNSIKRIDEDTISFQENKVKDNSIFKVVNPITGFDGKADINAGDMMKVRHSGPRSYTILFKSNPDNTYTMFGETELLKLIDGGYLELFRGGNGDGVQENDENKREERPISARYGADPTPEQSAGIDNFVKTFLDKKDEEKKSKMKPNDTKISENDGEDYERQSREVEYGINPYQEQPDMDSIKLDTMKQHLEWLESMIMNYDRAMMYDKKDEVEQQYYQLRNEISNLEQGNQLPF